MGGGVVVALGCKCIRTIIYTLITIINGNRVHAAPLITNVDYTRCF